MSFIWISKTYIILKDKNIPLISLKLFFGGSTSVTATNHKSSMCFWRKISERPSEKKKCKKKKRKNRTNSSGHLWLVLLLVLFSAYLYCLIKVFDPFIKISLWLKTKSLFKLCYLSLFISLCLGETCFDWLPS